MLLEDDEQFEHEEAWIEECQEIYLKLSTDTDDFLKEQLVLSQSSHEKGIAGTSVTVSAMEETTEILLAKMKSTLKTHLIRKEKPQFRLPLISLLKNKTPRYRILSPIMCKLPIT